VAFQRRAALTAQRPTAISNSSHSRYAPAGGIVGQQLHCFLWIIGFDRSGKVATDITWEVFDKDKKPLQSKPVLFSVEDDDEKRYKESPTIPFSVWAGLTKPGEFTLRITATDRNSKKTATLEAPLKVTAP
jgi:hypothetical protein